MLDFIGRTVDTKVRLAPATDERPLLGGLRIGKPLEDGAGWDNDGQYLHYLTKWMFALNRLSVVSGERVKHNK